MEWITVQERLPERALEGSDILIVAKYPQSRRVQVFMWSRWAVDGSPVWHYVTHWAPLPDLPSEGTGT